MGKGNKLLLYAMIGLAVFGSAMIISADMSTAIGDIEFLTRAVLKQTIIVLLGFIGYWFFSNVNFTNSPLKLYNYGFFVMCVFLLSTLAFSAVGGAHGWISIPGLGTIQPSEVAKIFVILAGAKLVGTDRKDPNINREYLYRFAVMVAVFVFIIAIVQHDFGSAIVLLGIAYCMCMVPIHKGLKAIHNWMIIILGGGVVLFLLLMTPPVTNFLQNYSNHYQIARFLAAANPFIDKYGNGYNLVMALVSFATGGWTGLGYGQSIHKYMNFPNPSTDFILPVIVEETGIIGFVFILAMYLGSMGIFAYYSLKSDNTKVKMVLLGCFMYFGLHFVFNVGGVSGLIPLTGVPLLMLSSGGTSTLMAMCTFGIAQNQIKVYQENENNRREV